MLNKPEDRDDAGIVIGIAIIVIAVISAILQLALS